MKKQFCNIALVLALASGVALAQTMPGGGQRYPNTTPPTLPDNQPPATGVETHIPPANLAAVQKEIQTALQKDPNLANSSINVQVTEKEVDLTGSVPNLDAKHSAEKIAKQHGGGLDIKNHLKVEKAPGTAEHTPDK